MKEALIFNAFDAGLLDIFSIQIMVSMVPKGTFFFLFGMFPHSWPGNYIRDNLALDYKIDVRPVFLLYGNASVFVT